MDRNERDNQKDIIKDNKFGNEYDINEYDIRNKRIMNYD